MQCSLVARRLAPLFIGKFLLSFVFWYSVEKIFMTTIGFDMASIGAMAALYSIVSVSLEIPSGILADRWSRKGVMILAAIALALSGLVGGLSQNVPVFLVSAIFWGLFDAMASGTADSMIYDTLIEEKGNSKGYEKILGYFNALGGVALIASALIGGVIGEQLSLRETFLWSVPFALLSIYFFGRFRDTNIQHESNDTRLIAHTRQTFAAIFTNRNLIWILVSLFALNLISGIIGEMYQLWYLEIDMPVILYGTAGAIVLSTYGTGGVVTQFFTTKRSVLIGMTGILVFSFILIFGRQAWSLIAAQFVVGFLAYTLFLALTAQMHRYLPSHVRAGSASVTNTVIRLMFAPLVLWFGWTSEQSSVFVASWALVALIIVGLFSELNTRFRSRNIVR
ncbi:MFS transporter [Candidatus Saccharibacteria bacterium]|nr:MFS transporter [Candidatus Saccharibacteria bacterium]